MQSRSSLPKSFVSTVNQYQRAGGNLTLKRSWPGWMTSPFLALSLLVLPREIINQSHSFWQSSPHAFLGLVHKPPKIRHMSSLLSLSWAHTSPGSKIIRNYTYNHIFRLYLILCPLQGHCELLSGCYINKLTTRWLRNWYSSSSGADSPFNYTNFTLALAFLDAKLSENAGELGNIQQKLEINSFGGWAIIH